jgi:hypothetical protein
MPASGILLIVKGSRSAPNAPGEGVKYKNEGNRYYSANLGEELLMKKFLLMIGVVALALGALSFTVVDRVEAWSPTEGNFIIADRPFSGVGLVLTTFGVLMLIMSLFLQKT